MCPSPGSHSGKRTNPSDGRHARSARHRESAVAAALELIRERGRFPAADEVAARAGLSRRTVFRLFDDMNSLLVAAHDQQRAEVLARFPAPLANGKSLREQVVDLVRHRARVYEFITPMRAVAEQIRHASPAVEADLRETREQFRMHLELVLQDAPVCVEERSPSALNAAELLTSWSAWRTLRIDQRANVEEATRAVERGVLRALEID